MQIRLTAAVIFILVILSSCQKQSAPTLDQGEVRRAEEMDRLQACTDVNFNQGVLLHANTLLLFKCTKWDKEFPSMYSAITKMESGSWNRLISPFNEAFLENLNRKNKFFKSIRELDQKQGLDDLSYVIAALNESNFFDAIRSMFSCIDTPSLPECAGRVDKIPSRSSIKQILHFLDVPSETVVQNIELINQVTKSIEPHQEEFRTEINKFKSLPLVYESRITVIDELMKKIKTGLDDRDRELLGKILLTPSQNGKTPWIFEWLNDEKLTREKFRDLLEYPILTNPNLLSDVRGLKQIYDQNFSCSMADSDNNPNELLEFDFRTHLSDYVSVVKNKSYKDFFDYTSNDIVGLKLSSVACKELEHNQFNVNLIKLMSNVADFLAEKKNYDIFKFLITKTDTPFDINNDFEKNLYLFDIIAGDIFLKTNNLSGGILQTTREFFPLLYDVGMRLPESSFVNAGEIANEILRPEHDNAFKGLASYWLFLKPSEKNFLFNFIDRHFDKDIKFVMLFNFYTKTLEDYPEVQPIFKKLWIDDANTEEETVLAIENFVKYMSGVDALADFKKFFSRNQIIKVLEVLSSGQKIAQEAREELIYRDSTPYVLQAKREKYKIEPYLNTGSDGYQPGPIIECMKKFSEIQNGLYELIRNLPAACQKVTNENIAFRLFGWMNFIESDYLDFKKSNSSDNSLMDKEGLLGPYMLNSQIGLLKIIDSILAPYGVHGKSNGLEYLLRSTNYHLNDLKGITLLEQNLAMIDQWLNINPAKNIIFRNALVKKFSLANNFSYTNTVVYRAGGLLEDYGQWVKNGSWKKATERSLGQYNSDYSCKNIINQNVAPSPCPSKVEIKLIGDKLLKSLANVWQESEESPIALLVRANQTGEGLEIPLDGKKTKKYRMTITEMFKQLYDTSDRSFKVNNLNTPFTNERGQRFNDSITTLERIETVIREVRFGKNYLGVSYLNHVVGGDNYNKDVRERKSLLSKCIKIPGIRCGKPMTDSDIRQTHNALASYDGLLDANNGRGLESRFVYGDFLKTLQQTLVGSSLKEAQEMTFLPLKDKLLEKHNGTILGDITMLTGFSNAARVVRDRIGRTRSEFTAFINTPEFKRVDRMLMNGFETKEAGLSAQRLIEKIRRQKLLDSTVDWISTLSYTELRLVEDTAARLLVVSSYLGSPELVFEKSNFHDLNHRYKDNNLFQVFLALEKVIDYWPNIQKYFPHDVKLIEMIKPLNTGLYFLTEQLKKQNNPEKNTAYLLINDIAIAATSIMFDPQADSRLTLKTNEKLNGLGFLLGLLSSPEKLEFTFKTNRENYQHLDNFHKENSEWFLAVGQNLKRMASDSRVDLRPLRDYLNFTSKDEVILGRQLVGEMNYHYDEPANLVKYLLKKDEKGISNIALANKKVFAENIDQIIKMINDIFPAIKIKEVHPPLIL